MSSRKEDLSPQDFEVTEEQVSREIWSLGPPIENPFKPDHYDDNSVTKFNGQHRELDSLESARSQPETT